MPEAQRSAWIAWDHHDGMDVRDADSGLTVQQMMERAFQAGWENAGGDQRLEAIEQDENKIPKRRNKQPVVIFRPEDNSAEKASAHSWWMTSALEGRGTGLRFVPGVTSEQMAWILFDLAKSLHRVDASPATRKWLLKVHHAAHTAKQAGRELTEDEKQQLTDQGLQVAGLVKCDNPRCEYCAPSAATPRDN